MPKIQFFFSFYLFKKNFLCSKEEISKQQKNIEKLRHRNQFQIINKNIKYNRSIDSLYTYPLITVVIHPNNSHSLFTSIVRFVYSIDINIAEHSNRSVYFSKIIQKFMFKNIKTVLKDMLSRGINKRDQTILQIYIKKKEKEKKMLKNIYDCYLTVACPYKWSPTKMSHRFLLYRIE